MKTAILSLFLLGMVGWGQTHKMHPKPKPVPRITKDGDLIVPDGRLIVAEPTTTPHLARQDGTTTVVYQQNDDYMHWCEPNKPCPDISQAIIQTVQEPTLQMTGVSGKTFTLKAPHINDANAPEKATLSFDQPGSGRIDRLSDEEYAKLQQLRKYLADAEAEVLKAHGVDLGNPGCNTSGNISTCDAIFRQGDTYEFRGQFLLISVPLPPAEPK